jgi:hypothetical protein
MAIFVRYLYFISFLVMSTDQNFGKMIEQFLKFHKSYIKKHTLHNN